MMNDQVVEYKAFIDGLVELARETSPVAQTIRTGSLYYAPPPEDRELNRFVEGLSPEQRELMAEIVQRERQATVAYVLSFLDWKDYRLSRGGMPLAVNAFAESYYDFTCRMEGDQWPDEHDTRQEER